MRSEASRGAELSLQTMYDDQGVQGGGITTGFAGAQGTSSAGVRHGCRQGARGSLCFGDAVSDDTMHEAIAYTDGSGHGARVPAMVADPLGRLPRRQADA